MTCSLIAVLALATLPAAASQRNDGSGRPGVVPDFIGAAVRVQPVYDGSDQTQTKAIPLVSVERDAWFVRSIRGVLEAGLIARPTQALRVGAVLAYEAPRNYKDVPSLSALDLPTYGTSASFGPLVEASYFLGPVPVTWTLRWRQQLESDRGAQGDVRLTAGLLATDRARAAAYAQWTWATARSQRSDYGIDGATAQRTGLRLYEPGSGSRYAAIGVIGAVAITPRWSVVGIAEARQLSDSVTSSPLVQEDSGFYGTLGVTYRF